MTKDEYEKLNKMVSQSIFPKEKVVRIILAGYPMQQRPNENFNDLAVPLRKLSAQLANMYNKFCFSYGLIGAELYRAKNEIYEVDSLLRNLNYITYDKLRRKRIKSKI